MDGNHSYMRLSQISPMDFVFLLSAEARWCFLQSAARILGCSYICLWTPQPDQSNHLASMDGWHHEDDSRDPSSSLGSLSRRLFEAYRNSSSSIDNGRVPGSAYKGGLAYIELGESDLMHLASTQIQRRFYQEAGIKIAVFMGCRSGEIEIGMTTLSNMRTSMTIQQVFSEEFVQHLADHPFTGTDQGRPSSSSSSLRSFSVGSSPEYSSLILTKASAPFMPEVTGEQALVVPPHQMSMVSYSRHPNSRLDEAAITRAMLAVISSSSSSSPSSPLFQDQAQKSRKSRPVGPFMPYNPALAPKVGPEPATSGQKLMKKAILILARIHQMRCDARTQETRPTSNQLHHMISERRRREKLNEGFHALRTILPPRSKKDMASVLVNARDYVNTLKAQISQLEERNRMLELQFQPAVEEAKEVGDSTERIEVQITRASESTSETQRINLRVTVRVGCDMMDLILRIFECLKEMGNVSLVSVDASTSSPETNTFARTNFTLQVQASDWDEESFKEAVTRAIDGTAARPTTTTS